MNTNNNVDEADTKVLLNTRIPLTWIFVIVIPIIWSSVKLNYTVENLVKVTDTLSATVISLNKNREKASREREKTNNKIELLSYRLSLLEHKLGESHGKNE